MAKRKLRSLDDWRRFSDAEVALLHAAARQGECISRSALREKLNKASFIFNMQRVETGAPTSAGQVKAFTKIEAASKRLLSALQAPGGDATKMPSWLRAYGGLDDFNRGRALHWKAADKTVLPLAQTIEGVWQLHIAASLALKQKIYLTKGRTKRGVNEAPDTFLTSLLEIWRNDFGRNDARSRAFYGFASKAFRIVDESVTSVAVRQRTKRWLTKGKSS